MNERFWRMVAKGPASACWDWTGYRSPQGYGAFKVGGKRGRAEKAHRVAFALACRPLKPGEQVLHSCDNPACCNPAHLRAGDHAENMRDIVERRRNRTPRTGNGVAKLSPEQRAEALRRVAAGENKSAVARAFNVTPTRIRQIAREVAACL